MADLILIMLLQLLFFFGFVFGIFTCMCHTVQNNPHVCTVNGKSCTDNLFLDTSKC